MRITEIAEKLSIGPTAVKRWVKKGLIEATLKKPEKGVGGHSYWDISEEEFNRYLKKLNG